MQTVEQKLKAAKFSMDTWFTGGDFASEAMRQIQTAGRRRFQVICFQPSFFSFCHAVASPCLLEICPYLRFGFDLDWRIGRACDIAKHSRKFLG